MLFPLVGLTITYLHGLQASYSSTAEATTTSRAVVVRRLNLSCGTAESPTKGLLYEAAMLAPALCPASKLL